MKQTKKAAIATSKMTNLRLDPLSLAKLDWCKAFYAQHGEQVSASLVFRRAIEVLTDQLGSDFVGKSKTLALEMELGKVLSCGNNKPNPFDAEFYPWEIPHRILKSFRSYLPSIIDRLPDFSREAPFAK